MILRPKFKVTYDRAAKPVSATCAECNELMPPPPVELQNSADIFRWMSDKYVEHLRLKHLRQREEIARGHIMERRDDMSGLIAMVQARRSTTIQ
jgi:hypothetical protein